MTPKNIRLQHLPESASEMASAVKGLGKIRIISRSVDTNADLYREMQDKIVNRYRPEKSPGSADDLRRLITLCKVAHQIKESSQFVYQQVSGVFLQFEPSVNKAQVVRLAN